MLIYALVQFCYLMRRGKVPVSLALLATIGIAANWLFYAYVLLVFPHYRLFVDSGDPSAWRSLVTAIAAAGYAWYFRNGRND